MHNVELPWPPKELMPNWSSGRHWAALSRKKQDYREICRLLCLKLPKMHGRVAVKLIFHPPDARHRDLDNLHSACKYLLDGLATAVGVDDRNFRPVTLDFGEIKKGGAVWVEIS